MRANFREAIRNRQDLFTVSRSFWGGAQALDVWSINIHVDYIELIRMLEVLEFHLFLATYFFETSIPMRATFREVIRNRQGFVTVSRLFLEELKLSILGV